MSCLAGSRYPSLPLCKCIAFYWRIGLHDHGLWHFTRSLSGCCGSLPGCTLILRFFLWIWTPCICASPLFCPSHGAISKACRSELALYSRYELCHYQAHTHLYGVKRGERERVQGIPMPAHLVVKLARAGATPQACAFTLGHT